MKRLALVALLAVGCTGCATGQTGVPYLVSHQTASVAGNVVSTSGGQVEYWFEYGTTSAYGSETPHGTISVQRDEPTSVSPVSLDGLARATVYHYRLCARDSSQQGGSGCGEDRTVKTQSFACGETITSDVRFTGWVLCRTGSVSAPGLVIGAPGITIDLHGFGLEGPVAVGGSSTGLGIDNSAGFDEVTIRDGYVGGFGGDGIRLNDASRNRILHVRSIGSPSGIEISGGSANEVRYSHAGGRTAGLLAQDTTGLIVADSTAEGENGMAFSGLLDSRIVRNDLYTLGGSICCFDAIRVAGNRNVIKENEASNWGGGVVVLSGGDNRLLYNRIFNSAVREADPAGPASSGDGIFVSAFTAGTIVRRNQVLGNDGDGIEVQSSQTRIADNVANANSDFGIDAAAGVTDLGGNSASGNGNPLQCRNVFCR